MSAARTPTVSARSFSTASLARPPSGGAVTRTFHEVPYRPTSPGRAAPGTTRSSILAEVPTLPVYARGRVLFLLAPVEICRTCGRDAAEDGSRALVLGGLLLPLRP